MKLEIQRLDKNLPMPSYAHLGDAAFDLYSSEECTLKPMEKKIVKSGIIMAIPKGFVGNIRDRSGMAAKFAIHTMAGIIDSGYRGEIGVVLINLGKEEYHIKKADRIAQMLIQPIISADLIETDEIQETLKDEKGLGRGEGGFGSTGKR